MQHSRYNRARKSSGRQHRVYGSYGSHKGHGHSDEEGYEDYYEDVPQKKKSLTEDPKFIFGIVGAIALILIIVIVAASGGGESPESTRDYRPEVDEEQVRRREAEADSFYNEGGKLFLEAQRLDYEVGKIEATPKYREAISLFKRARQIWADVEMMYKSAGQDMPSNYQSKIHQIEEDIRDAAKQAGTGD
ncbi:MAG: hypothetical protein N2234_04235 [Planctomycetota bacterium]|nr:hypothetical protein [Planctomycetota bacterium]